MSRDRNGLRLSEGGRRLIPHVNQAIRSLDAMREEVSQLAGTREGTLRIAAVPSLAGTWVPRLIRDFYTKFPGVEVGLFEGTDDEVSEWVVNGVAHAGFAALPVKGTPHPGSDPRRMDGRAASTRVSRSCDPRLACQTQVSALRRRL